MAQARSESKPVRAMSFFMSGPCPGQARGAPSEGAWQAVCSRQRSEQAVDLSIFAIARGVDQPGHPHLPGDRAGRGQPGVHLHHHQPPARGEAAHRPQAGPGRRASSCASSFCASRRILVHMTAPLFTIDLGPYSHGFSIRDLVLLVGGAYLIYKGISELREMLKLTEVKAAHSEEHKALHLHHAAAGRGHHHGHGPGVLHRLGHHGRGHGRPPDHHDHRRHAGRASS